MLNNDYSFDDLLSLISNSFKEYEKKIGHCNVLVIGKTGIGKSTLINAVFRERLAETGVGDSITQGIRQYKKQNCPITIYDTPGLELSGQQIESVMLEVSQLIEDLRLQNTEEHIHVVWYCVNHEAYRFEQVEEEWIKNLELKDVPVILVLTQAITIKDKESKFLIYLKAKNLPVCQIIPVLAEPKPIDDDYVVKAHGLARLVKMTLELLPEVARKAFVREQIISIDLKVSEAFKAVMGYITGAAVVGASPIPFSDAPILVAAQTGMIAHISAIFGLRFDREFIGAVLSAISGTTGMSMAGRAIVANLLKMIPGAGTIAGAAISGSTAAALTLALGLAYIELLKIVVKAQINGQKIPESDLKNIFVDLYKDYIHSGRRTLRENR